MTVPVTVTVSDTDAVPQEGLPVYAFSGGSYTGYNGTTDAVGQVQLTLPQGDYRFRSDRNGTQFWSGTTDHCTLPGCESAAVTVTIPLTVTVQSQTGTPYPDLPVYAFDGTTYTGFNGTTDASGEVVFTLPQGDYRFRSDFDGVQFWSDDVNHCTIPGCLEALVEIPGGTGVVSVTIDYTYDPLQRLTAADYSTGEYFHYSYDAVGNRLTQDTLAGSNSYAYDIARAASRSGATGQPPDRRRRRPLHLVRQPPSASLLGAGGNLLDDGASTYAYDDANRLVEVVQGADIYEFEYNGLGDRLSQTVNTATTEYTVDLAAGLTQVLADGSSTYLYGLGRIGEEQASGFLYHHGDALGSVRQLTDASGTASFTGSYEPYGSSLEQVGSGETNYGFTGEWMDATGLVNLRARYYSSDYGRWIQLDPMKADAYAPVDWNRYGYVRSNPANHADPSGMLPDDGSFAGDPFAFLYARYGWDLTTGSAGIDFLTVPNFTHILRAAKQIEEWFNRHGGNGKARMRGTMAPVKFVAEDAQYWRLTQTSHVIGRTVYLVPGAYTAETVIHELGHIVDNSIGPGLSASLVGGGPSDEMVKAAGAVPEACPLRFACSDYEEQYSDEQVRLFNRERPPTTYGLEHGPSEDFADTFMLDVTNPTFLADKAPERARWMHIFGFSLQSAQPAYNPADLANLCREPWDSLNMDLDVGP